MLLAPKVELEGPEDIFEDDDEDDDDVDGDDQHEDEDEVEVEERGEHKDQVAVEEQVLNGEFPDGNEATLWLSTFISPSLRTLNLWFAYGDSILSHLYTTTILGLLTQKCPQLRRLGHKLSITAAGYDHEFIEQVAASQLVLTPFACGHLQSLQHLAQLTIRGNFINSETLVALSCLSKLEKLTINQVVQPNKHLPQVFKDAQLSEGSFSALRRLQIRSHILDDFLAAWNTSPLVLGLKEISLEYESTNKKWVGPVYEDTILRPLLLGIATSSPNTESLTLTSTRMDHPLSTDLGGSPWTCIEHLPLRYLELVNFEVDAASLKNVEQIWHKLDILNMPDQLLTLQHLVHLSRLPKLKKLCAAGFEDLTEQIPEAELYECSPLHTIKLKKPMTDQVEIKSTEKVARFLLVLWPKLQRIVYVTGSGETLQPNLELLNVHIRMFQGLETSKKRILKRYGSDAVKLLDRRLSSF
ncbi:hypothetical protein FRC12_009653 [Ceratobasidium sp. 428]|nr:hypothetical protein FRC12_009653 [Ceratobasidium sp. 428]